MPECCFMQVLAQMAHAHGYNFCPYPPPACWWKSWKYLQVNKDPRVKTCGACVPAACIPCVKPCMVRCGKVHITACSSYPWSYLAAIEANTTPCACKPAPISSPAPKPGCGVQYGPGCTTITTESLNNFLHDVTPMHIVMWRERP
jgi:hypothetical protein